MPGPQAFAENVWTVDGPDVRDFGVTFTTRMTVVKLSGGSLWLNSPVPVSFDTLKRITELGPVQYLVAATPRHVWRLEGWHSLFPEAQLWAPRSTPLTLSKGDLPFTGLLSDTPYHGWAGDFDQLGFKGNPLAEEVIFFHKQSRTVILDDLIQHMPIVRGKLFRNALARLEGLADPPGAVALEIRLFFINRRLARRSLQTLLSWDFDKLIIAHGSCIESDAKPFVQRAFKWLGPS